MHFRVWAPDRQSIDVVFSANPHANVPLTREATGYFSGWASGIAAGALYRYRIDGGDTLPDPASRYQPEGPHGPSCVIDPAQFAWTDGAWKGRPIEGQVIYEMHVGTFTREGTWQSAMRELEWLAELGVTTLEVMPVAEFPGRFGWGYDGVDLYAPSHLYGTPDDFRRFVDRAHGVGLGVILDVVYNHLGPDGNWLPRYSSHYFRRDAPTEWGDAINFDGEHSAPVREFFAANGAYWVDEFHLDGLRLDATQSIRDESDDPIVREITRRAHGAVTGRSVIVVAENEPQHAIQVRRLEEGGHALDAMWNDDFHHSAHVVLTGRDEAYYTDYRGMAQEFVSMAKYGFLYQGQHYKWQRARRGMPTFGVPPSRFVVFLQNHDQIANSARGDRIHALTSAGCYRAMTALLLLGPQTPMLFQGQEFGASSPFLYFADHNPELAQLVRTGRAEFLEQFPSITGVLERELARPDARETFERCILDWSERDANAQVVALHRDLLQLRRDEPCFRAQRQGGIDGAVLGDDAFVLRYFGDAGDDRLLCINLGRTVHFDPAPEPLLAPPQGKAWRVMWSSEDPRYDGLGTPAVDAPEAMRDILSGNAQRRRPRENWRLTGHCAVAMAPEVTT